MNYGDAKCPICGRDLETIDTFDLYIDGNQVVVCINGWCKKCKTGFSYDEFYEYKGHTEPKKYD